MDNIGKYFAELWNQDNATFVTSVVIMIVGIVASSVAALPRRKARIIGMIVLAAIFDIFAFFVNKSILLSIIVVVLSVVWIILFVFLSQDRDIISRDKLDKLIQEFTAKTDYLEPLCIFGGDLDFFGDVVKTLTSQQQEEQYRDNSIIQCNKQFHQLKQMKFKNINILSVKPSSDQDRMTRIRIGFLKKEFGDTLTIKFINEKECTTCAESATCLSCDVCKNCPKNKGSGKKTIPQCEKLLKYYKYRCYNPDTKLRGRVAKDKKTGAPIVAIVTTYDPGKSYILKEYSSNTKECTIYQTIWDVWWKKCVEDSDFIALCVKEYEDFIK